MKKNSKEKIKDNLKTWTITKGKKRMVLKILKKWQLERQRKRYKEEFH